MRGGKTTRWAYLAAITLFGLATSIFAIQNFDVVPMSFLSFKLRAPLAVLTLVVYFLGAATRGSLLVLLRRTYEGSKRGAMGSS